MIVVFHGLESTPTVSSIEFARDLEADEPIV